MFGVPSTSNAESSIRSPPHCGGDDSKSISHSLICPPLSTNKYPLTETSVPGSVDCAWLMFLSMLSAFDGAESLSLQATAIANTSAPAATDQMPSRLSPKFIVSPFSVRIFTSGRVAVHPPKSLQLSPVCVSRRSLPARALRGLWAGRRVGWVWENAPVSSSSLEQLPTGSDRVIVGL